MLNLTDKIRPEIRYLLRSTHSLSLWQVMCFWISVKEIKIITWQWGCNAVRDQVSLTVYFLDVNVISLRVIDGDLLFKFALSEDETFLQSDETEIKNPPF